MIPTQSNLELYPEFGNNASKVMPDDTKYTNGFVQSDVLPAEWMNWAWSKNTKGITALNSGVKSMEEELNALVQEAGNTPTASNKTQVKTSVLQLINNITGTLSNLTTTSKTNLVSAVNEIVTALSGKAPKSHASTNTTYGASSASNYGHAKASGTTPSANGTASVGTETSTFARGDHVHPLQTSVSGNAGTATKLKTARNLKVALGSETAVTFDGSANQNSIPISGTLELGHGGTGATTIGGAQAALFAQDSITGGEPVDSDCLLSTFGGSEGAVSTDTRIVRRTFKAVKDYMARTFFPISGGTITGQTTFNKVIITEKGIYNYGNFNSGTSDSDMLNHFYNGMVDNSCMVCNAVRGGVGNSLIMWRTTANYGTALWLEYSGKGWMYFKNNGTWTYKQIYAAL